VDRKLGAYALKRWTLFCLLLVFWGILDCLTTVVGVSCFGATEGNPLLASLTEVNLFAFSGIKLAAAVFIGVLFYKAGSVSKIEGSSLRVGSRFLQVAYSMSLITMLTVVTNNVMVVTKLF
jgi:hypothetical protein